MSDVQQTPEEVCVCHICGAVLAPNENQKYCAVCTLKATFLDDHDRIGPYVIDSPLGAGGMGEVYLAFHETTGRAVALKVPVTRGHHPHDSLLKRFAQEAHVLSLLDHPGILPIYEVGEEQGRPWFAMKLAEGGTLADRLSDGQPLPSKEAARILLTCASAVQHAHNHGILHRDIKPHNILIDENDQPMLGDFGLARLVDRSTELSRSLTAFGTPGYSAPEITQGRAPSVAADLFSLGAIFYHMLSGSAPFCSDSLTTTLELTRQGKVEPLDIKQVPIELSQICLKCLEPEPQDRYASVADLERDLQAWLEGRGVSVRPLSPLNRLSRLIRRHPLTTAWILSTSLVVTASLVLMLIAIQRVQHADALQMEAEQQIHAEHRHLEHLDHIRLLLSMPRASHRREALRLIRDEWTFRPGEALRSLAIRALSCGDFKLEDANWERDKVNYSRAKRVKEHSSPNSGRTAIVKDNNPRELIIQDPMGNSEATLSFEDDIVTLQWNKAGDKLAIGCLARNNYLWKSGDKTAQMHVRNRESASTHFCWHPKERLIACRTEDGALSLWDILSKQEIIAQRYGIPVDESFAWEADGEHLTWTEKGVKCRVQVILPQGMRVLRPDGIGGKRETFDTIEIQSERDQVLWVTDEGAWIWDLKSDQHRMIIPKFTTEWMGARFTQHGISTCGWSSGLRSLSQHEIQQYKTLPVQSGSAPFIGGVLMTSSPGSKGWLAFLQRPSNRFILAAPGSNKVEKILSHQNPFAVALTRDSRLGATSSFQNSIVKIWNLHANKPLHELHMEHTSSSLCFSPDGGRLATVGSHQLYIWDTTNGHKLLTLQANEPFQQAAWSSDGKILAVQTYNYVRLFRASDGLLVAELTSPISQPGNRHVALTFDLKRPLLGEQLEDGSVILWDLDTIQKELHQLGLDWPVD